MKRVKSNYVIRKNDNRLQQSEDDDNRQRIRIHMLNMECVSINKNERAKATKIITKTIAILNRMGTTTKKKENLETNQRKLVEFDVVSH